MREATKAIQAALKVLSVASKQEPTGNAGTAEETTDAYRIALQAVLAAWIAENGDLDLSNRFEVIRRLELLADEFQAVAAEHLPEMYAGRDLAEVLQRLQRRFAGSFDFRAQVASDQREILICFEHCALARVVRDAGQSEGSAALCGLFHEYWAGLLGAFTNRVFALAATNGSETCSIKLQARD